MKETKAVIEVDINDFSGGVNMISDPSKLKPNQAWIMDGWHLDEYGAMRRRWGSITAGTVGASGDRLLSWEWFSGLSGAVFIVGHFSDGSVRRAPYTGSLPLSWTTIFTGYSTTQPMRFCRFLKPATQETALWMTNAIDNVSWVHDSSSGTVAGAPKGTTIQTWKDMLWISGRTNAGVRNRVWNSAPGDGTTWPALNFVDIGLGRASLIGVLMSTDPAMVCFSEDQAFVIYDPVEYTNTRLDPSRGCLAQHSIVEFDGSLYYLSQQGICRWLGDGPAEVISRQLDPLFFNDLLNQTGPDMAKHRGYKFRNRVGWVIDLSGSPWASLEIYPNLPDSPACWQMHGFRHAMGILSFDGQVIDALFAADPASNNIVKLESFTAGTDLSAAMTSTWRSGWLDFGDPDQFKYLSYLKLWVRCAESFTLDIYADGNDFTPKKTYTVDDPGSSNATWEEIRVDTDVQFRYLMIGITQTGTSESVNRAIWRGTLVSYEGSNSLVVGRIYAKARGEGPFRTATS